MAEEIAGVFARAVTAVDLDCTLAGAATAAAAATASATAVAEASAEALLDGMVSVETCGGCSATVNLFGSATRDLFVEAVASASASVRPCHHCCAPVTTAAPQAVASASASVYPCHHCRRTANVWQTAPNNAMRMAPVQLLTTSDCRSAAGPHCFRSDRCLA